MLPRRDAFTLFAALVAVFFMTLGYLLQLHQLLPLAACRSASVALPDSRSCYSLQTFLSVRAVQCGRQAALRRDMSPLVTSRVLV